MLTIQELRKYHTQKTTDFAYLLGAWQTEKPRVKYQPSPFFDPEKDFVDSPRFSATRQTNEHVCSFFNHGETWSFPDEKDLTIPLKMHWCDIETYGEKTFVNGAIAYLESDKKYSFSYGAYPQTIVSSTAAEQLEKGFQNKTLKKTQNSYTYFIEKSENGATLCPQVCHEYEFKNARYVRIIPPKMHFLHALFTLSNGVKIQSGKPYWVKVEPLKWHVEIPNQPIVPQQNIIAYMDVLPIAGITYNKIKPFLKQHFCKEIMQSHSFCYARACLNSQEHSRE